MRFLHKLFSKRRKKEQQKDVGVLQRDIQTQVISTPQINLPDEITLSVGQDIGTREQQQDYCAYSTAHGAFAAIVCDGMGGLEGSEQASRAAATTWMSLYENGFADFPLFAEQSVVAMDRIVQNCKNAGGTTAAAIWIKDGMLHWMSIGDSKIYIVRDGVLVSATREHNYQMVLGARLKRGEITEAEYNRESVKGASLISYIGRGQTPLTDISREPLKLHECDIVLVCSDGLYKSLPEEKLEKILTSYTGDFETIASYMLDYASKNAKRRDNTTIVAVRYNGEQVSFLDEKL